jgi:hypothetical protein
VEILKLWSLRAGSLPLNYLLISTDAERGRLLIEAAIPHHQRWGLLFFRLPSASYASMHTLADASFPALHSLWLNIPRHDASGALLSTGTPDSSKKLVEIRDAPKLRNVDISSSPNFFAFPQHLLEIPWEQLETLDVAIENDKWVDSVSTLVLCTRLMELTFSSVSETPIPVEITSRVTMTFLRYLDLGNNPYDAQLLDHFILPQLRRLSVTLFGSRDDLHRMQALFARAVCPIQHFTLILGNPRFLRRFMALAPTVIGLHLRVESTAIDTLGIVGTALQPGVLPALQSLAIEYPSDSVTGQDSLVEMLTARRVDTPERARLPKSFQLVTATNCLDMTPYGNLTGMAISLSGGGGGYISVL